MFIRKPLNSLYIASTAFLLQVGVAQAAAPVYRQLSLPAGMSVPYFGKETPYTGLARAVVRASGEPGKATVLLNVDLGSQGREGNPSNYLENKRWAGMILDQVTGGYTKLLDSGKHQYKTVTVYAADANIHYPVGFAYNEATGLSSAHTQGAPILWEQNAYGEFTSRYLPLPSDIAPQYTLIPFSVSDDGRTVSGTLFAILYSEEDYLLAGFSLIDDPGDKRFYMQQLMGGVYDEQDVAEKTLYHPPGVLTDSDWPIPRIVKNPGQHLRMKTAAKALKYNPYSQVIWTRSAPGEDFKVSWVTNPILTGGKAVLVDTSANSDLLLYSGVNSEGTAASFLARLNVSSGSITSVETYGKTTSSYLMDPQGQNVILKTPLEAEDYLIETAVKNFTSAYATRFTRNGMPEEFLLGEDVAPYTEIEAFTCFSSYPPEVVAARPGDSGIREARNQVIQYAFSYLKDYCNVKEMQPWNHADWHFVYLGKKQGNLYTYYGYYNGSEEILFEVTVDQSQCKRPAYQ